jgi:hypothetical protein
MRNEIGLLLVLTIFTGLLYSCGTTQLPTTIDVTAPTLPSAAPSSTAHTLTSISLSWEAATDNGTAAAALSYAVYYSTSDNVGTVADAEANGTLALGYAAGITTGEVTGLTLGTSYYFTVIVKDESDNKTAYATFTASTLADTTAPTVDLATVSSTGRTQTTIDLSWNAATDDVTAAASLQYQVYYSASNNIDTVANAEANGTVATAYTANLTSTTVSGLAQGTGYYFNVVVKDAAGNKLAYSSLSQATTCFLAETLITLANGEKRRIDAMRAGDWVRSFDENGNPTVSKVGEVVSLPASSYLTVRTTHGTVRTTAGHPFYAGPVLGFLKIGLFQPGDSLYRELGRGLSSSRVTSMKDYRDQVTVYNLHITQGPPTDFANGFAGHNY